MNIISFVQRNSSTILSYLGACGTVATAILAVKATPKALERIKSAKEEKQDDLTISETIRVAGSCYIPAVLVGVGSIICIFGSHALSKRQQASLVSAYTLLDRSFKEYKAKLKELYGEETHNEIVDSIAAEKAENQYIYAACFGQPCDIDMSEDTGEPVLFYDDFSRRYFEATIEQVLAAEYHLNRNYILRGYATLNEFYEFLGIDTTDYGDKLGWIPDDSFYWIDFCHRKTVINDDLECYILEIPWGPSADFLEYYN